MKSFFSWVWSFWVYLFLVLAVVALAGRNHFVTGSMLSVLRWPVVGLGLITFVVWFRRKKSFRFRQKALLIITALYLLEAMWIGVRRETLQTPKGRNQLTFLTYNLFFRNHDKAKTLGIIEQSDADILFLQEVTPSWKDYLNRELGEQYPFRVVKVFAGTHGIAVYSKLPLKGEEYMYNSGGMPFAQLVTVDVEEQSVNLCNVHMASPAVAVENRDHFYQYYSANYVLRELQYEKIKARMATKTGGVQLVIGDLNTPSQEPLYTKITDDWVDVYADVNWDFGWSFPNTSRIEPVLRLDYCFVKGNLDPVSAEVLQGGSSDHLAVKFCVEI